MAVNGVYGTSVGSIVDPTNDIDMFYSYSETRGSEDISKTLFMRLDSALLEQSQISNDSIENMNDNVLEGLYNLKLPMDIFNRKGFYTVYIKPKEHNAVIQDVGVLSSYPDVKGIIIDSEKVQGQLSSLLKENNSLVGYRIIYFDNSGTRQPYYRIITSNNKCEPIVQNLQDTNQKSVRYRYNESSSLIFLTVTPSVSTTFKANSTPYIGNPSQRISLVNTKFEPIMLDIEMVENDFDTISTMLEGSQLRDLDNGLITTFNKNNEIYAQHEVYTLKDEFTSTPVFEVKKNKNESIDFSQTIDDK